MKEEHSDLKSRLTTVAVGSLVVLACLIVAGAEKLKTDSPAVSARPLVDDKPPVREVSAHFSFAPIVKKVSPGVVKVVVTSKAQTTSFSGEPGADDFWRHFFGNQPNGRFPGHPSLTPHQEGVGSGVIVTKDGYILTNNHVVDGADTVKVSLQDGRDFTAKVVGRDPKSDVAVIKIDASDLPALAIGDSEQLEVGDLVLAVGNPFGIGQTVTTGIVSAKDRGSMGLDYEDFIQTDAAINPGNSGGALVDEDGRLIGINTAILSRSGGNQGIGFAIPINLARDVMDSLIKDGHVTRGYLGVSIQDLTPALSKEFDLKTTHGALVGDVTPQSPAEKAGVKSGDVIVEFKDKPVADSRHLKLEVARTTPGQTVPVKVLRDGSMKTLEITVKALPGSDDLAKTDTHNNDTGTLNGVGVADLDDRAREQYKVPDTVKGAVVTEVDPDSASAQAGLQSGDVIQEINRHPVKNSQEAVQLTEHPKDKITLLRLWRDGGSHFIVVDESKVG